jgi:primase/DNA polymerase family protein
MTSYNTHSIQQSAEKHIPTELKNEPSWVLWRYVVRDGKRTKEPYQTNRRRAKTNSSQTWTTFDKAREAYERDDFFDGLGFVFHEGNPYAGADFDDVTEDEAREWIDRFDSYTERSPSGNGLHIIIKAELPQGTKRDAGELYNALRFFTVTGDVVHDVPIRSAQDVAEEYYQFLRKDDPAPSGPVATPSEPVDLPDDELLQKAANSKLGDEFQALWAGDASVRNGNHSSADYALMKHLLYWTGGDEARAVALFDRSGLARRDKWRRRADYREATARKARMACTKFYRGTGDQGTGQRGTPKSAQLEAAVQDLRRRWAQFDWARLVGTGERPNSMRGHTCRDVALVVIEEMARHGEVSEAEGGIRVSLGRRTMALRAATSLRTVHKATKHLEAEGWWVFEPPQSEDKPASYFMRASLHQVLIAQGGGEKEEREVRVLRGGGEGLRAPRLRWSSPGRKARRGIDKKTRRVRDNVQPTREVVKRLGKVRGAVIDTLEGAGGTLTLTELTHAMRKARPRDLRRRTLPMLEEAGIIAIDGETVTLVDNWLVRLEEVRVRDGEVERERLDVERHKRQREAFRNRHQVKPTRHWTNNPQADGAIEDLRRADEPEPEKPQPYKEPSRAPVDDVVAQTHKVDELVRHGMKRRFALEEVLGGVELGRVARKAQQGAVEAQSDWRKHPLSCECEDCLYPEPRYARSYQGAEIDKEAG